MEEKKKMTLKEFEKWLNEGTKVYVNGKAKELRYMLRKAGITESKDYKYHECCAFCVISLGTSFWLCDMSEFAKTKFTEILVEDILSIEIIKDEPKVCYDEILELAKPLRKYLMEHNIRDSVRISETAITLEPLAIMLSYPKEL